MQPLQFPTSMIADFLIDYEIFSLTLSYCNYLLFYDSINSYEIGSCNIVVRLAATIFHPAFQIVMCKPGSCSESTHFLLNIL